MSCGHDTDKLVVLVEGAIEIEIKERGKNAPPYVSWD
jgi:hypothetical protein